METQLLELARKRLSPELIDKLGPEPLDASKAILNGKITMNECIMLDNFIVEAKQLMYGFVWSILGSKGAGAITIKLFSYPPNRKIPVIKLIREATGLGLRESKYIADRIGNGIRGVTVCEFTDIDQTRRYLRDFRETGCKAVAYVKDRELDI